MSHVNRARAQRLMRERRLDAIVLAKPESYTWASGAPAGVAAFFRRAGACLAVVPADPSAPIQVVTTDYRLLCDVLPGVVWRDASATVGAIKVVKSAAEIERLQTAAAWAEAGMVKAIAAIHHGVDRADIAQAWQAGVAQAVQASGRRMSGQWEYITVGPLPWQGGGRVQDGDVIKFDVGCLIDGYSSDSGRTFVCGQPRQRTLDIAQGLQDAFEAGLEVLKPGQPMSEVHRRATAAMHRAGFVGYQRGHFGHSLGHDTFCEVAPFLAQEAHDLIEPGMVLAFETPFYVDGEGGFIIEDQFLITSTGAEPAWSLPRPLQVLAL
jgi:Xaa-Pro dipeptidase